MRLNCDSYETQVNGMKISEQGYGVILTSNKGIPEAEN
jgi:hypothetical protein